MMEKPCIQMKNMDRENLSEELIRLKKEKDRIEKINKCNEERILKFYTLYNISKTLNFNLAIEEIFNGSIEVIGNSLKIDEFNIMLFNEDSQELTVRAWYPNPIVLPNICLKIDEGVHGIVVKTGKPVLIKDLSKESNLIYNKEIITDTGSFMCLPLTGRYGNIIGVFNIYKREPDSFTGDDEIFFSEAASQIAISIEKAKIYEKTKTTTMLDALTGIYNRRYFFEYLERELARANRYKKCFSIFMIDIDYFKNFNDKNGHMKGDHALKQAANLIVNRLRFADIVARYGGEEFACILPETDSERAINTAEEIRKIIEGSRFDGGENQPVGKVTVTIGTATYPDNGKSSIELIDYADRAMYRGKRLGKNMVCSEV